MMLELLLTRLREREVRDAIYANLSFLVFDELHALLIGPEVAAFFLRFGGHA
jgi:hypothetical protein